MKFFRGTPGEIFKYNILVSNWIAFSVCDVSRSFLNTARLNYSTRMLLSLSVFDVTVTTEPAISLVEDINRKTSLTT